MTQSTRNVQVGLPDRHAMKVLQAQRHPHPRASVRALDTNTPQNAAVAFHLGEYVIIDIPEEKVPPDDSGKYLDVKKQHLHWTCSGSADTHLPGSLQGKGELESMFICHTFQNQALSFEVSDDSLV